MACGAVCVKRWGRALGINIMFILWFCERRQNSKFSGETSAVEGPALAPQSALPRPPPTGHPVKRGFGESPSPGPAPRPRACALRSRSPRPSLPRPRGRRHRGPGGAGGGQWPARLAADNAAAMSPSPAGAAAAAAGPRARPGGLGFGLPPVPRKRAGGQRGSSGGRSEGCGASLSSRAA